MKKLDRNGGGLREISYFCAEIRQKPNNNHKNTKLMIELLTGWLGQLKNADHVGVTMQINDAVKGTEITNETYKTAAAALAKAIEGEDDAYRKTQKDWAVEQLKTVDGKMDAYMKGMRSILAGHAALPDDEELKQKAKELLQLWKDFDFKTFDSYSGESAKVINMFQEVTKRKADAEAVGVWGYFEKAQRLALDIQELLSERFDELASRTVDELKAARRATDTAIKQLYLVLTSLQVLSPTAELTELVKKLRAIEDYARVFYLKSSSSSGDNTPGEGTGGGEDAGGDTDAPTVPPGSSGW